MVTFSIDSGKNKLHFRILRRLRNGWIDNPAHIYILSWMWIDDVNSNVGKLLGYLIPFVSQSRTCCFLIRSVTHTEIFIHVLLGWINRKLRFILWLDIECPTSIVILDSSKMFYFNLVLLLWLLGNLNGLVVYKLILLQLVKTYIFAFKVIVGLVQA